jgi:cytoskeleton-associated protein 5
MLRMLENCNHTYIFCVLFGLLRKYKDYKLQPKLPSLIIKCLLKLSKLLDKLVSRLEFDKVLIVIHEYLVAIDHDNKTQNDEMGIRIVKTMVNDMVKCKGKQIWESYKPIEQHENKDRHIIRWIKIILNCSDKDMGPAGQMDGADMIDKYENMDPAERQAQIEKEL